MESSSFGDKPGMSINTEGKQDDRELPGINLISFSKAQEPCSAGLTLRSLAETCAHACSKPWPPCGSWELQGKDTFRSQGEGALGSNCLLGSWLVNYVTSVLGLEWGAGAASHNCHLKFRFRHFHQVAGMRSAEAAAFDAFVKQCLVFTPGRCFRFCLRVFHVGLSWSFAESPISLTLSKYGCRSSCSQVSLSAGFMWRQP